MIHAHVIKNLPKALSCQIVQTDILETICSESKSCEGGVFFVCLTKKINSVTSQILRLYGFKVNYICDDTDNWTYFEYKVSLKEI